MKGLVYTIRSKSSELVYYGSTIEKMLSNRMAGHRKHFKYWLAGKRAGNCTSYQILALGDAYIELVEEVEVETRPHLRALEGKYQRENKCVNKYIAGRTKAEYNSLPEVKAALKAYNAAPERKAYQAAYEKTPKAKAVRSAYAATPEARAAQATRRATPEARAAQAARRATPEYKAALAAYCVTPEYKAAKAAHRATPEAKAARAVYQAAYRLKRKTLLN